MDLNFTYSQQWFIFLKNDLFLKMSVCVCLCEYMPCVCRCLQWPEEGINSLKLELQAAVRSLTGVLGTKLGFPGRAARALNHWVTSPAPTQQWFKRTKVYIYFMIMRFLPLIYLVLVLFLICLFLIEEIMHFPRIVKWIKILDSIFAGIKQWVPNYVGNNSLQLNFYLSQWKRFSTTKNIQNSDINIYEAVCRSLCPHLVMPEVFLLAELRHCTD